MSETVRVGIIGAGANAHERHIPHLRALDDVELLAVCNRTRESTEAVTHAYDIPIGHKDWQDVIADPDLDAIVIGTWPNMHCRVAVAALKAGKHVLCEARMARSASEAWEMLSVAQANPHLVAQLVPAPTTFRVDSTIRRLLAEGYLGDLLAVEIRAGGDFLDRDAPLHWRQDAELSGYNVMSLGIWYETIMRWVGEATSALALARVFVKTRKDVEGFLRPVLIPDHIDVLASLACGAQAHFQISAVTALGGDPDVYLFGSQGTLRFSGDLLCGGRRGVTALEEVPIPLTEQGTWRVEEEFINAIRGVEPVRLTTFEDGVKYMEFTEAVARSIATGRVVALPLFRPTPPTQILLGDGSV